ncbi:glycosyltransferase [Rhodococcus sp. P1Y]|nr:glycosyltransferase [Rhodococcus sp. P1Y]
MLQLFRRSRHYPIDIVKFTRLWFRYRLSSDFIFQGPLKFPLLESLLVRFMRQLGARCAVVVHDVVPHYRRPFGPFIYKIYYRSFSARVFHTGSAKSAIDASNSKFAENSVVVPHGNYDIFNTKSLTRETARAVLNLPAGSNRLVVLSFGNIEDRKGIHELLDAHVELTNSGVDPITIIAGKRMFDSSSRLAITLKSDHLPDDVVLADYRIPFDQVQNYFSACDVVVLPYREGSTSGVLKLAMAFGKPVVAAPVGDLRFEVNGDLGILMKENWDASELAQSIATINERLGTFSELVRVESAKYGWTEIVDKVVSLLDSGVVGDKPADGDGASATR